MKEKRLMNKEYIDSLIRCDDKIKTFVLNGKDIVSAPIRFNQETYDKDEAMAKIQELTNQLWQNDEHGKLTYMDDLREEMIDPLMYQIAYEEAMHVLTGYMDEFKCSNMMGFLDIVNELKCNDERIEEIVYGCDYDCCTSTTCFAHG